MIGNSTVETTYSYNDRNPYLLGSVTRGNVSNYYGYDSVNRLISIYHNGFNYNFTYDQWGNRLKTMIQNRLLSENQYEAANGNLLKTTYGNGDWWSYTYDSLDRVTKKRRRRVQQRNTPTTARKMCIRDSIGSISYNGVRYAFLKNLQGDVIAILDTNSNIVARYTYDAWGRILSITDGNGSINTSSSFIGNVNPIRYRGYYYDTETGWYYLNSRYYDPQVKRFISADGIIGANGPLTGVNLFAYCNNCLLYTSILIKA